MGIIYEAPEAPYLDETAVMKDAAYGKSYNDLVREIVRLRTQRDEARRLATMCIPLAVQYDARATERVLRGAVEAWGKDGGK